MKKSITFWLSFISSCVSTVFVFVLLWMLCSGIGDSVGKEKAIFFSEDGSVLNFFGETLYISRDTTEKVLQYPSKAAKFCISFLPNSVNSAAEDLERNLSDNAKSFVTFVKNVITGFFTVGTGQVYSV